MLKKFGDIIGGEKKGNYLSRLASAERLRLLIKDEVGQDVKVIVSVNTVKVACQSQDQLTLLKLKIRRIKHLMHRLLGANYQLKISIDRSTTKGW